MGKVPWKELVALAAALVGLGLAWAVARGLVQDSAAATVNAAAAVAVAAVILVSVWRASRRAVEAPATTELRGEWRRALIDRVRLRWIGRRDAAGRLTGGAKLAEDLALGGELELLVERVIAHPAEGAASVLEAWRRSGHAMVLTGGPGTGKSVQLLLLAEKLLDEAKRDGTAGVPVVLGLAAWRGDAADTAPSETSRGFEGWLVAQIHATFGLAPENARSWLASGALIPILDGLDEAPVEHQSRLFRGIAAWVTGERPPVAWALGCRTEEYLRLDPERRLTTRSSSHWSTRAIDDRDRLRFLAHAQESFGADWQPVMDALARGEAAHLTSDNDRPGVLASPLGIAIAIDAYRPAGPDDPARPADLIDQEGGWDRLWERYVAHRYATAHTDPDRRPDDPAEPFGLDDVRRWLGTISSDDSGLGRYVDITNLRRPDRPASWGVFYEAAEDSMTLPRFLGGCLYAWLLLFAGFGAVVGWQGWSGRTGALLGLAVSVAGGLMLLAVVLRLGADRAAALLISDDAATVTGGSRRAETFAIASIWGAVLLLGLPGFVVTGAKATSLGAPVARWLQPWVSKVDEWSVRIADRDIGVGRVELGPTATGALTGAIVDAVLALALGLLIGAVALAYVVAVIVRHGRSWLDHVELERQYEQWLAKHALLRWWRQAPPDGGSGALLPHPRDWDRFLHWAAHRGYLRRVGRQYLWMHETLRIWFQRHLDRDRLCALFDGAPER